MDALIGNHTSGLVDPGFWAGKRVLLTGHTGFKGAWLATWLLDLGATVTGLSDRVPTEPSLFALAGLSRAVDDRRGDLRDPAAADAAVTASRPDVVLHLAAQSLVRASYADPVGTYATNVMGTVNVLDAVRRAGGVPVTVVVTSDKCYANREWPWGYREQEPMGGADPYSSSKGCAELVVDAYRSSFGTASSRLASARAGNVIGGGDWGADRLLPDLMQGALAGRRVVLRKPMAVRPWQHVLDCLSGYLVLAQQLWEDSELQGGWNFGPDATDQRTVQEIVRLVAARWPGLTVEHDSSEHPHEAGLLALDSALARQRLGWRPEWAVEKAVERVVDWYEVYRDGGDIAAATQAQVRSRGTVLNPAGVVGAAGT